jgi:hypothetical protein
MAGTHAGAAATTTTAGGRADDPEFIIVYICGARRILGHHRDGAKAGSIRAQCSFADIASLQTV